jgi:hypothetical protein
MSKRVQRVDDWITEGAVSEADMKCGSKGMLVNLSVGSNLFKSFERRKYLVSFGTESCDTSSGNEC